MKNLLLTLASCQQDKLIGEWNFNKVAETDASKTASRFSSTFFESGAIFASNGNFLILDSGIANPFQLTNNTNYSSYNSTNRVIYGNWKREDDKHTILLNILNDTKNNNVLLDEIKSDSKKLKVKFKTIGTDDKLASLAFFFTKDGDLDVSKSQFNYLSTELNT